MSQGLRPHYHQEFRCEQYYDRKRHCIVKKIPYMCMSCGRIRHEKYDCYLPPPKRKDKTKVLEKNKKKRSDW